MIKSTSKVGWRERSFALASLGSAGLLTVAVVGFSARNLSHVIVGVLGLGVLVAGAWWVLTERVPRRAIGAVGTVLGAATVVVALLGAEPRVDSRVLALTLAAVLSVASVLFGRAALYRHIHEENARRPLTVRQPTRPVLICNPWSGGGKVDQFGLVELAHELGVEVIMLDHGLDLEQLAREAVARRCDCLAMAGGDGSQALVASIAIEHDLPFVCIAAGTRNHFALDLGLDREDPRSGLDAFRDGIERRIDYATVGRRLFVNNVSLGIYATIVQQPGYRDAKSDVTKALLPEMLGRSREPFDLQFTLPDGTEVDGPFLIQVSNNPYALGATMDASQRRRLDTGRLGIVAITASSGVEAAKVVTLSALGQRRRSRNWHEFTAERFEVRARSGKAYVGIDGEALELETPLEFEIHAGGLRLLVPRGNLTAAERRQARNVSGRDLILLARGIDPLTGTS